MTEILLYYLLAVTILVATLILFLYLYFQYQFTYWESKNVPYFKPIFPYGSIKSVAQEKLCFGEQIAKFYQEMKDKNYRIAGYYMFSVPLLLPLDLDLIKVIMTKDFNSFNDRGCYSNEDNDPLNSHIGNLGGSKWKYIRKKITPNFTAKKMKMIFNMLLACSEELEIIMEEAIQSKQSIEFSNIMARFTIDNIGTCAFGLDMDGLRNPDNEFLQKGQLFFSTTLEDPFWHLFSMNFPRVMDFFKIRMIPQEVSNFYLGVFKEAVTYREETQTHRNDMLDYFMKLTHEEYMDEDGKMKYNDGTLTFNQIAAQAFAVLMAGYETSSTTLSFCMAELALNPEIQHRLRQEIWEVLERHGGEISYEAIMEMIYMDQVLNETLRKFPTVPLVSRECTKDYKIPGTNITIEKGIGCWISILGVHRNPEYYPDPDKFDPERFSDEEKDKIDPCTYFPFGDGPRICIGFRFGILQMKIGLTRLLSNYEFSFDSKIPPKIEIRTRGFLLFPKHPILLQVSKVDKK